MPIPRFREMRRAAVVVVFALAVAACGGDSADDTTEATADGSPATTNGGPATAPASSDTDGPTGQLPDGDAGSVVRVLDGDSLIVSVAGEELEVRLLGINAPERSECHGDAARAALESYVAEGGVVLVGEGGDQFDRELRYVYATAGRSVNERLVLEGHALALAVDHDLVDDFRRSGRRAFNQGLGMWASAACGTPVEADLALDVVEWNAPGADGDNLNGEFVDVRNDGDIAADLGGWGLRDESAGKRFSFPEGTRLDPGATARVYSGCGEATASEFYWCSDDPVWNNAGDTAMLTDPAGNIVDRFIYEGGS